jgi:predicted hydrocarbon binding protein
MMEEDEKIVEERKLKELKEIEEMVKSKMSERERIWTLGKISSVIICKLAKHLIKNIGYSSVATIIQRELREIGKKDAKKIIDLFGFEIKNVSDASKVLKIAALLLGMNLDVKGNETIITECPYGESVKEFPFDQPFYCNVCREYCKGLIEGTLGDGFVFIQSSSISKGDSFCAFRIVKK